MCTLKSFSKHLVQYHVPYKNTILTILCIKVVIILSPEREMRSISSRGPIELFPFIVLVNVYWTFKTCLEERPFWNLENVLSPEGRCVGISSRGPIELFQFIVLVNVYWTFKTVESKSDLRPPPRNGPLGDILCLLYQGGFDLLEIFYACSSRGILTSF